ncbi:MAG: Cob(I)alamin adenosyltransferase [Candidatus Gottesmanbacteria bacterium GW2011_GWB1_43_11]|uniref:Cob(I)alamin adenosyltransferase n=1 Tax=Candidatus Gottesmanbacteria bacterium GW2011_GWB1_43_11 TaxID=1618446 RepID=A0A0G1FL89_9BACT|nr:MAG: Cob(I)alamin adenosyltransferase [Candidatus Gottesmanbacteria bacterium GW2011_GWC1_43_10]KKS87663.1 MAG: Cob(I)alamin adenosyltransferase [Candidatus Gottesmanbacteria bacterium GW2011_GWB1_43_11]OGG07478.1 MAG: cob(I)yrinic acid a,c-diamide adenosyltransferase [Candidatus Gottesmanbacteria bacterium RIFCSPHIGHO2_01_FULL_43_15]HCM37164.1 cob(I)yrinic acid a,c-diamide adenosyltransferase [Patescibacteria group bacterium]
MRDRGLIIVYTGDGKGKTTAALGMALRTVGWGGKVLVIQFIKLWKTGEHKAVEKYIKDITIIPAGSGFVGIMGDKKSKEEHKASAINAFELAKKEIMSKKWPLVILDEINGAIEGKLVELKEVLALLASKPEEVTVVLTGREAKSEIMEAADLVTEMKKIKHPYDAGILAKKGVDY